MVKRRKNNWVRWSKDEIKLLKRLFPLGKARQVAEKTGRSLKAVKQKAYDMGLGTRQNRRWSASEIEIVKRLYPIETARSIGARLGRSEKTVSVKARSIGVKKAECRLPWSTREDALLKKLYPDRKNTKADIAEKIGRSIYAIGVRAYRLGLRKRRT